MPTYYIYLLGITQTDHECSVQDEKRKMPTTTMIGFSGKFLCERIFRPVKHTLRLIEANALHSEITENVEKSFSVMRKCNCTVVRESALDENVAVESAHFLYCENAYAAE